MIQSSEMIFSIIGPPGSGKTTHAKVLSKRLKIPVLFVGELLRKSLSSRSPITEKVERIMKTGGMVPSNVIKRLIMKWVNEEKPKKGFIFDGFPRRLKDAKLLHNQVLPELNVDQLPYIGVINLDIPLETTLKRILERSKTEGKRPDDTPMSIRKRYRFYLKQKPKLKEFYSYDQRWSELDGRQKPHVVQRKIERLVKERSRFLDMQIVLFLGAPGSGKDTQAQKLEQFGYEVFSSGEAFRREISLGTKIGNLIRDRYIKIGKLVPDKYHKEVVYKQIAELIRKGKKVALTGVVRTLKQAQNLDKYLALQGNVIRHVILLNVPKKELIERLSLRRVCPKCGFNYHLKFIPPKKDGICDRDGARLIQREDETPQAIETRLKVQFYDVIKPVLAYYKKTGRLHVVDGSHSPERVANDIRSILGV